jgi:excisionase family DNA binding protein
MRQMTLLADAPGAGSSSSKRELRPRGLPIAEAAEYLGVSRWTVQRLRSRGELVGYHVGAAAMIELDSIDAYVERSRDGAGG